MKKNYCLRRQFIIVMSLLTFTYTIVFILLGVGCLYVLYLASGDHVVKNCCKKNNLQLLCS